MQIDVTCRHTRITPTIKRLIEERLARLERFSFVREAHVVIETVKYRQIVEIQLKTRTKEVLCREEGRDMAAVIELAVARLERQLKKMKEKKSSQRLHDGTRTNGDEAQGAVRSAARAALRSAAPAAEAPAATKATKAAKKRARVAEPPDEDEEQPRVVPARPHAKPLSVEEAVLELAGNGAEFLAFVNADTEELNVVYRRKDGDLGWIERAGRRRPRG
jgi:putative sigma-54 modulation protein